MPLPSIALLARMLEQSGIRLNRGQLAQLWAYHSLLRKRNQDRDLTRIIGFESMVFKHYVDSMIVGDFVRLPSPLLDVGTGAGFPGIPLKIRYPNLHLILAEPRPRRIAFLQEAIELLKFKNVRIFEHKVISESFKDQVDGVITRAVEEIDKTLSRSTACLKTGGQAIFLKGPQCDNEIDVARQRFRHTHTLRLNHSYTLPHTPYKRRLVVFERTTKESNP